MNLSNKTFTIIMIISIIIFPIFIILLLVISYLTAKNMANPKKYSRGDILKEDSKGVKNLFDLDDYIKKGPLSTEILTTIDNKTVEYEIWGDDSNNNYVILVHGMYNTRERMYKYAEIWNAMGYNAIVFDGRGWGTNAKFGRCTMGYKEPDLIQEIYIDIVKKYKTRNIGLHGESMGGATVFNWVKRYRKFMPIKFIITEGGYMNFKIPSIVGIQKYNIPKWVAKLIYPLTKFWLLTYRVNLWKGTVRNKDISKWFNIPIFIMHSTIDKVVPFDEYLRIKKMLNKNKVNYKHYESNSAEHVRMITNKKDQNKWIKNIDDFIKEVNNEK